jgi:predicted nucleic acid-binding protein
MRVFLDSNVLMDLILLREPEVGPIEKIITLCGDGKIGVYCSSLSISHVFYSSRKIIPQQRLKSILKDLTDIIAVAAVDKSVIAGAFSSSIADFEDAIQHECALAIKNIDYIITSNRKDFKYSAIKTLSPSEFIKTYDKIN